MYIILKKHFRAKYKSLLWCQAKTAEEIQAVFPSQVPGPILIPEGP